MKITKIETIRIKKRQNLLWVKVHTDEGIVGLGETWFGTGPAEADIHERIAGLILGEDPSKIEMLNRKMRPYVGFYGTSAEIRACSAVDVALWDIAGKVSGKPVCALLGGKTRENIKVYNTCAGPDYISETSDVKPDNFGLDSNVAYQGRIYQDLDGFLHRADEVAAELLEMGIDSMKIWPFDFTQGAVDGVDISVADLKKAVEPFEKIRKAHGDKMKIKAELHGLWSVPAAKKIISALAPIGMDWIEDPIWMDRISDIREIVDYTDQPISGGESLGGLGQMRELLELGRISVPIIDVTWGGGITFSKKSAALAESFGKSIAFHDCSGPVTLAASTHLALACPTVSEQEITRAFYYGWYHEITETAPPIENGFITVPDAPGHGVSLREDFTKRDDATLRITEI
ncbi:MAG: mandelate racemase/muconate lactonizing enzyme family protein [Desulfobacter sp.]